MQILPYSKHCNIKINPSYFEVEIEGPNRADKVKEVMVENNRILPTMEDSFSNPGWVTLAFSRKDLSWEVFARHFGVITPEILDGFPH